MHEVCQLSRYDVACRALAEARNIDEVRNIANGAEALKEYARRARNRELEVTAAEIRLKAERRCGELINEMKASGQICEGRPGKITVLHGGQFPRKTLDDIGASRNFSAKCQRLAALPADRFDRMVINWRARALVRDEPVAFDLFAHEKQERRAQREAELGKRQWALPNRRYGVILADPDEMRFETWSRGAEAANSLLEIIKARDIASIAADDCSLWFWTPQPKLRDALDVMETWGFEYKSHFVWAKDRIGPGYWSRNKHEILLLGVRGEIPCPAPGEQWDSLMEAPRKGQGEKPEVFIEMIEAYFPTLPKIQLNQKGPPRRGWDAWGAEAEPRKATG